MAPRARRRLAAAGTTVAERQADALKELGHWSRWLVTVESALLAGIVAAGWLGGPVRLLVGALIAFSLSLASATMVLGAIPDALQRRPLVANGRADIYGFVFKGVSLRWWARGQHLMAGLGLGFLFLWAVTSLWQRAEPRGPTPSAVIWVDAGATAPPPASVQTNAASRRPKACASSCSQARNAAMRGSSPRPAG